jgi:hypothetical protein
MLCHVNIYIDNCYRDINEEQKRLSKSYMIFLKIRSVPKPVSKFSSEDDETYLAEWKQLLAFLFDERHTQFIRSDFKLFNLKRFQSTAWAAWWACWYFSTVYVGTISPEDVNRIINIQEVKEACKSLKNLVIVAAGTKENLAKASIMIAVSHRLTVFFWVLLPKMRCKNQI